MPVVLVEGEKCAMAGHQLLGHEFDFVSWPGGANAWAKANWGWLMGRTVFMWPDADAKREKLTRAERDAGADPATKPYLPEHKQPGVRAMRTHPANSSLRASGKSVHTTGRPAMSFEIVYGHAFKAAPRRAPGAETSVSLSDMRAMVRTPRPGR